MFVSVWCEFVYESVCVSDSMSVCYESVCLSDSMCVCYAVKPQVGGARSDASMVMLKLSNLAYARPCVCACVCVQVQVCALWGSHSWGARRAVHQSLCYSSRG